LSVRHTRKQSRSCNPSPSAAASSAGSPSRGCPPQKDLTYHIYPATSAPMCHAIRQPNLTRKRDPTTTIGSRWRMRTLPRPASRCAHPVSSRDEKRAFRPSKALYLSPTKYVQPVLQLGCRAAAVGGSSLETPPSTTSAQRLRRTRNVPLLCASPCSCSSRTLTRRSWSRHQKILGSRSYL
jgi:hypothetical protein